MTFTKEEFKHLYHSFEEAEEWYDAHQDVFNDSVCDRLLNPYYEIFKMINVEELIMELHYHGSLTWTNEDETIETTSDLDRFYDVWIAGAQTKGGKQ